MSTVVVGNARFTLLGPGLLRLEYAPDGAFDDRPTFRAITMPSPRPFVSTNEQNGEQVLTAPGVEIRYRGPDAFRHDNLVVRWDAGGLRGQWSPGDVDHLNLGGIPTLDHIRRSLLPRGIHPAGIPGNDRIGEKNLGRIGVKVQFSQEQDPATVPGGKEAWKWLGGDADLYPEPYRSELEDFRKFPPGMVSRAGYTVLDETGMAFYDRRARWIDRAVRPDYQNIFFFAYGHDYARGMRQFTDLCGRAPLIPRWAFGPWYSCFQAYSIADHKAIVKGFADAGIPLDVLIVDMDWHVNEWDGWEWNRKLYPDLEGFFDWAKQADLQVALNLHSETINRRDKHARGIARRLKAGDPLKAENPAHLDFLCHPKSWLLDYTDRATWEAVRDVCHRPNEQRGVDFWWLDLWQGLQPGYNSVLWVNHLACEHMEMEYGLRPLILGRYSGIGSHRYPAYFSGDTFSHWEVLDTELEANLRAGQVGMNYFSHDLGGFVGHLSGPPVELVDPELYARWMQMGALSPVMRVHSNHSTREPWKYGPRVLEVVRQAYHLHMRLVPYLYHLAREAYECGLPIHRPLYFLHPEDDAAYAVDDEYFIGERMLAAPVAVPGGRRKVYVPAGAYWDLTTGNLVRGPVTIDREYQLEEIPLFARAGSIIPQQEVSTHVGTRLPSPLVLAVYPGGNDALDLYEDDGFSPAYRREAYSRWPIRWDEEGETRTLRLLPMRGEFAGMPARRDVRLEAWFTEEPLSVKTNGGRGRARVEYDTARRLLRVTLRQVDVEQEATVALQMA